MNGDGSTLFFDEQAWAARLLSITKGCRPDMHEPDEQALDAQIVGTHAHKGADGRARLEGSLDNAMGDHPDGGELVLTLCRERDWDDEGSPTDIRVEHFNLATLVALARLGACALQETNAELMLARSKLVERVGECFSDVPHSVRGLYEKVREAEARVAKSSDVR